MKQLLIILSFIVFSSCTCGRCEESVRKAVGNEMVLNTASLFYKTEMQDSLVRFIKSSYGIASKQWDVIYSVDIARYQQDTLISFWAYKSVLSGEHPFDDSRFLLEINKDKQLLMRNDWMHLYHSLIDSNQCFRIYGAKEIDKKYIIALTSRNLDDIADICIINDFDIELFDRRKYISEDDDRIPFINIYRYSTKGGLKLLYRQNPNERILY